MVALRSWYRMIGCPQFKTEDFRVCEHGLLSLAPLFVSLAAGHRQPPIPKLLLAKGRMIWRQANLRLEHMPLRMPGQPETSLSAVESLVNPTSTNQ